MEQAVAHVYLEIFGSPSKHSAIMAIDLINYIPTTCPAEFYHTAPQLYLKTVLTFVIGLLMKASHIKKFINWFFLPSKVSSAKKHKHIY